MITDLITFAIAHPFLPGLLIGGCLFGGPLGIIGWLIGYEHAMRKVGDWMRPVLGKFSFTVDPRHTVGVLRSMARAAMRRSSARMKAEASRTDKSWGGR